MIDDGRFEAGEVAVRLVLARYAASVLDPDVAAMVRVRQAVRAEAQRAQVRRRAEALAVAALATPTTSVASRPFFPKGTVRRAILVAAAALLLGGSIATSAFAASRAGGPLYDARLWAEAATLPRDPDARFAAELVRADQRLTEAAEAVATGDTPALRAALTAYEQILGDTVNAEHDATQGTNRALDAIDHHRAVLLALQGQVPEAARDAIGAALARADAAAERVGSSPPADPGRPGPGAGPGQSHAPGPSASPKPTPRAEPTPKPHPTPSTRIPDGPGKPDDTPGSHRP